MQNAGKTILFVTHSVEMVQAHCSRGIYLKSGEIRALGEPKAVIQEYLEDLFGALGAPESDNLGEEAPGLLHANEKVSLPYQKAAVSGTVNNESRNWRKASAERVVKERPEDLCPTRPFYNSNEYRWGDQQAAIYDYTISGPEGPIRHGFERGQRVSLELAIFFSETLEGVIYGFTIKTVDGRTVFGANTRERGTDLPKVVAGQRIKVQYEFVCSLIPGEYFISVGIAQDDPIRDNVAIDRRYDLIHMPVSGALGDFGVADVNLSIDCVYDD
jgi:lipopolysaccharide transport system ATP-binding protein